MVPHVIRLHSAWQLVASKPSGKSVQTLMRSFGRPTGVTAGESVWLVLDPALLGAEAACNGRVLSSLGQAAAPLEFDITDLLADRNELRLSADSLPALPGGGRGGSLSEGLVKLEIRRDAWIKDLSILAVDDGDQDPTLRLAGEIVVRGAPSALALVVTVLGRELLYREVGGGEFQFDTTAAELPRWKLGARNELADLELRLLAAGHVCWQARLPVAARPPVELRAGHAVNVAGQSVEWPAAWQSPPLPFEPSAYAFRLAEEAALAALPRVLPNAFYRSCDELGLGILQRTPPGTSPAVVRQLLRHPSILDCGDHVSPVNPLSGNRPAPAGLQ